MKNASYFSIKSKENIAFALGVCKYYKQKQKNKNKKSGFLILITKENKLDYSLSLSIVNYYHSVNIHFKLIDFN